MNRFSLTEFYKSTNIVRALNGAIILLLVSLIVLTPLPFGSVENQSIFLIEVFAAASFFLWVTKLLFFKKKEELSNFRAMRKAELEQVHPRVPFFHRYPHLAIVLRTLTFGRWPRRHRAENLIETQQNQSGSERKFYSVFGYPVRNTSLEMIGIAFLGLMILQIIPLPHFLIWIVSPNTAHLYELAARSTGESIAFHPFSLDPFTTFLKVLEYSAYFMIYIVIVNSVPSSRYFRFILAAVLFSSTFQAFYGLAEYLTHHQHIFFYKKIVNEEVATGSFINRNHYATYLEMSLPLLFGIVGGYLYQTIKPQRLLRDHIANVLRAEGNKPLFFPFLIPLLLFGIYCSLSRSGILFTIISSLTFFLVIGLAKKDLSRNLVIWGSLFLVFLVSTGVLWEPLYLRFAKISTEFTAERARLFLYRDTARIFLDFPAIGTGLGTFMQVFPMYRSFIAPDIYRYAHNDYLQLLSECGLASIAILAVFLARVGMRLRQLLRRPLGRVLMVQLGAFCSLISLAMHSLTDFGIQIPAIAVLGVVVLTLFWRTPAGDDKAI